MAYDFHYTPTGTGVISGKEVLEQTEDAINDLGNTAISGVQEALDKAEQALTNSANAVDDAQTALNTANNAEGVAIQAQTDVSNLSGTVTNIGNRVTTAEGNISNLQGRMTTAEGNITNLQGRMTTAETNIGNLQTAVSTAQATANSAQQTATTARQQSYVFRYSSTALVASSTNSNTLLDNTDNLKVGDKVVDSSGVLFSVTAIDTVNSTFTIGSALIDLALDSNVVHKTGNETVTGTKIFSVTPYIYNSNSTANEPNIIFRNSKYAIGDTTNAGEQRLIFADSINTHVGQISVNKNTAGTQHLSFKIYTTDNNNATISSTINYYLSKNGDRCFTPYEDSLINLGVTQRRWKGVYATNYYYGANNVEFSTKFVTTDTSQNVIGRKTFIDNTYLYNSDDTGVTPYLVLKSSKAIKGDTTGSNTDQHRITHVDKNNSQLSYIQFRKLSNGGTDITLYCATLDTNNQNTDSAISFFKSVTGSGVLIPIKDNDVSLGNNTYKWKDVNTYLVNGLTPSSLSMPTDNLSNIIDISSYLTVLDGTPANTYQAPSNGYISITTNNCTGIQAYIIGFWGHQVVRPSAGGVRFFMPICKNMTANILIFGGTIDNARFIPCQGNV